MLTAREFWADVAAFNLDPGFEARLLCEIMAATATGVTHESHSPGQYMPREPLPPEMDEIETKLRCAMTLARGYPQDGDSTSGSKGIT